MLQPLLLSRIELVYVLLPLNPSCAGLGTQMRHALRDKQDGAAHTVGVYHGVELISRPGETGQLGVEEQSPDVFFAVAYMCCEILLSSHLRCHELVNDADDGAANTLGLRVLQLHVLLFANHIVTVVPKTKVRIETSVSTIGDGDAKSHTLSATLSRTGSAMLSQLSFHSSRSSRKRDDGSATAGKRQRNPYKYENITMVLQRLHKLHYAIASADWIANALLSASLTFYIATVDSLIKEIEHIDDDIMYFSSTSTQANLHLLKRIQIAGIRTNYLYWFMHSKQELLLELDRFFSSPGSHHYKHMNTAHLLSSIVPLRYNLQELRETLQSAREVYLNIVGIEFTKEVNRANVALKRFGAIFTITMPLMVVLGMFSMNVPVPGGWDGGLDRRHTWFYWFLSVFLLIIISGVVYGLRMKLI